MQEPFPRNRVFKHILLFKIFNRSHSNTAVTSTCFKLSAAQTCCLLTKQKGTKPQTEYVKYWIHGLKAACESDCWIPGSTPRL